MAKRILLVILFLLASIFLVQSVFAEYKETELDKKKLFKVVHVVDGDTLTVNIRGKNESVRLLGIDTPESVDPRKPVQCFAKEATSKLKSFVQDKYVRLIDDPTQGNRDKYSRLLRYVYLPDSKATFVNGEMVKQGYAFSYKEYPTKMLEKFNNFEKNARANNLGLWGSCQNNSVSPTSKIIKRVIQIPTKVPVVNTQQSTQGGFVCNCSKTCANLSCSEAQYQLNSCGCSARDGDGDGIACDSKCQ